MNRKSIILHPFLYIVLSAFVFAGCGTTPPGSPSNDSAASATSTSSGGSAVFTVNQQGEAPSCAITPRSRELDILSSPAEDSAVIGKLPANNWVQVSQRTEAGWYQLDLPETPVNDGWVLARGADLTAPCACGQQCLQFEIPASTVEITDCEVSFAADDFITIYFLPDTTSSVFAVSTAGDDAAGVAQAITEDNWIGYDPGVQSDETGVERLRWIQGDNTSVSLNGTQCIDLPVYGYTPVAN